MYLGDNQSVPVRVGTSWNANRHCGLSYAWSALRIRRHCCKILQQVLEEKLRTQLAAFQQAAGGEHTDPSVSIFHQSIVDLEKEVTRERTLLAADRQMLAVIARFALIEPHGAAKSCAFVTCQPGVGLPIL